MLIRRYKFTRLHRVRKSPEFEKVFLQGTVAADNTLVVHAVRETDQPTRIGLSVSRKVGPAVVRNRWKRLIREAFRKNYRQLPPHLTLVVRPRKGASPKLPEVAQSLVRLANRLSKRV